MHKELICTQFINLTNENIPTLYFIYFPKPEKYIFMKL